MPLPCESGPVRSIYRIITSRCDPFFRSCNDNFCQFQYFLLLPSSQFFLHFFFLPFIISLDTFGFGATSRLEIVFFFLAKLLRVSQLICDQVTRPFPVFQVSKGKKEKFFLQRNRAGNA